MYERETVPIPGVVTGTVEGVTEDGRPVVTTDEGRGVPTLSVWTATPPDWRACVGLRVAVAPVGGDPSDMILIGLLDPPPVGAAPDTPETLRVESRKELVIECGKAKIALRADGRIEIRGGHLVSRSTGPNKIKGASVHIN